MSTFEDRSIVVTGGAAGIGRAMVEQLAAMGARVGVIDVDDRVEALAASDRNSGRPVHAAVADVSDEDDVAAAVRALEAAIGPVDGLVNNAGIVDNIAPFEHMSAAAWERELAVNLSGAFNTTRAVIGGMRERQYGRIVNISSLAARGGLLHQAGYAASKAGMLGLTRTIALEYARHGVTCNAVLPGLAKTEKVEAMPEEIKEQAVSMSPARRLGEMAEIASLVTFLLTPESGYVNGADIDVSGGSHLNLMQLGSRKELAGRKGAGG